MDKLEVEREERWWSRFERAMGLRFRREDLAKVAEAGGNMDQEEVFLPMTLAISAAVTGIMSGGVVGLLKNFWGIAGEVGADPEAGDSVGPSPELMKAVKLKPLAPGERVDPKKVVNISDPRSGMTKAELLEKFPLLKVRGFQPVAKKRPNPRGERPPGML